MNKYSYLRSVWNLSRMVFAGRRCVGAEASFRRRKSGRCSQRIIFHCKRNYRPGRRWRSSAHGDIDANGAAAESAQGRLPKRSHGEDAKEAFIE